MVTTGQVILAGEVKSEAYLDVQTIARQVISRIGYTKSAYMFEAQSCGVLSAIHEQSSDINQGVERANPEDQGAGDQGMMFGYACRETENLHAASVGFVSPLAPGARSHSPRRSEPDAVFASRLEVSSHHPICGWHSTPERIEAIVVSTQHDDFDAEEAMLARIRSDVKNILIPRVKGSNELRRFKACLVMTSNCT